ncbi:hypothetical protein BKA80DRAFT_107812 [Phyllosticta citrichinensis]
MMLIRVTGALLTFGNVKQRHLLKCCSVLHPSRGVLSGRTRIGNTFSLPLENFAILASLERALQREFGSPNVQIAEVELDKWFHMFTSKTQASIQVSVIQIEQKHSRLNGLDAIPRQTSFFSLQQSTADIDPEQRKPEILPILLWDTRFPENLSERQQEQKERISDF